MRFCAHLEGNYEIPIGAKKFFRTWRVPVQYNLSSYGGGEFIIAKSKEILNKWRKIFLVPDNPEPEIVKLSIKCIVKYSMDIPNLMEILQNTSVQEDIFSFFTILALDW
jgi:hypothetical protein